MARIRWLALLPVVTIRTEAGSRDPGFARSRNVIGHVTGQLIRDRPNISGHLPAHWARLDVFEGHGYQRVVTTVHMPTGDVDAYIYVLLQLQD